MSDPARDPSGAKVPIAVPEAAYSRTMMFLCVYAISVFGMARAITGIVFQNLFNSVDAAVAERAMQGPSMILFAVILGYVWFVSQRLTGGANDAGKAQWNRMMVNGLGLLCRLGLYVGAIDLGFMSALPRLREQMPPILRGEIALVYQIVMYGLAAFISYRWATSWLKRV